MIRRGARISLDRRLGKLQIIDGWKRPPRGWVRAIRDALGLTAQQLAQRLHVTQPRIVALEQAEVSGAVSLATLERAAAALNCTLVYALIPNKPLEQLVEERARVLATQQLARVNQTMRLEDQALDEDALAEELSRRIAELSENPRRLWD